MGFLRKLLIGKVSPNQKPKFNPIERRILNIRAIWNNDHQFDNGIEKIVRLFLSSSQLLFPGVYIKYSSNKIGHEYQDLALDLYVLAKVLFPFLILTNHWQYNHFILYTMVYLLLETVLYIPTLIFASDLFTRPRSYKRSLLMLFFNYMEIVFSFAVLYTHGNNMNKPFGHWFEPDRPAPGPLGGAGWHPRRTSGARCRVWHGHSGHRHQPGGPGRGCLRPRR